MAIILILCINHSLPRYPLCLAVLPVWKEKTLSLEVDRLVADTVESLRPSLTLFASPEKAYECALSLEKQFRENLGEGASPEDGEESEEEEETQETKPEEEGEVEAAEVREG